MSGSKKQDKKDKLAQALRENLAKRKAQMRERREEKKQPNQDD